MINFVLFFCPELENVCFCQCAAAVHWRERGALATVSRLLQCTQCGRLVSLLPGAWLCMVLVSLSKHSLALQGRPCPHAFVATNAARPNLVVNLTKETVATAWVTHRKITMSELLSKENWQSTNTNLFPLQPNAAL
jgi:hypothetical protein